MKDWMIIGFFAGIILFPVIALGPVLLFTAALGPSNNTREMCHALKVEGYLDDSCFDDLGIIIACINGKKSP